VSNNSMMEQFKSKRGAEKLAYMGFTYNFDKFAMRDTDIKMWRCDLRGCKGRIGNTGKALRRVAQNYIQKI
jgi:hypothetical protein